jgi:hypothetical protein
MGSFFSANFSGGMNEWLSPALLKSDTAALLVNADISTGKIVSLESPAKTNFNTPEQLMHYGSINRSVVKIYNRTYWSNNDALNPPFFGGDKENYLGIPFPVYNTEIEFEKLTKGGFYGKYKYCVTYVNENGWESAPGSLEDYERVFELDDENIKIKADWHDRRVASAKVYRTQKEGADFYCIGTINTSGGSLTDTVDDLTLVGLERLTTADNYPPPEKGRFLCEAGNVFFLAEDKGSTLYFSLPGNPHAWPPLNFIGFDDEITGITPEFQGVLVFTRNSAYRITGAEDINTLIKTELPGNQGCVNCNTIAQISNAPVWLSNDGICLWNGENINIISRRIIRTERLQAVRGVSANDCYYLFLQNGAIVYDHRNGDVFYKLNISCDYAWYDADVDVMYLQRGNEIYKYAGGAVMEYKYISPFIGIPESEYIFTEQIIICIDGSATVTLKNEDKIVFTVRLKKSGKYQLKAPYNTLGKFAQIEVSGKGTLKEIGLVYR